MKQESALTFFILELPLNRSHVEHDDNLAEFLLSIVITGGLVWLFQQLNLMCQQ